MILLSRLAAGGAVAAAFAVSHATSESTDQSRPTETHETVADDLPLSPAPPWPRAVVDAAEHDFGVMAGGRTLSHRFTIRNEGEAPLRLKSLGTTCECTMSELARDEVPPGECADVTLTWTPEGDDTMWRQRAQILTNDPDHRTIELVIRGRVEAPLSLRPAGRWDLGRLTADAPASVVGTMTSRTLESFRITGIEASSGRIDVRAEPLDAARLRELDATAGYEIRVTAVAADSVDVLDETFTLLTDVPEHERISVRAHGRRAEPIRFHPRSGFQWHPAARIVSLGRVSRDEGAKAVMRLFVRDVGPEGFYLKDVVADPSFVGVVLEPVNVDGAGNGAYDLVIEIPPGSPPVNRMGPEMARLRLETSHAAAPEIRLNLEFLTR